MRGADLIDALAVARNCGPEIPDRAEKLARLLGLDRDGELVIREALEATDESAYESGTMGGRL